MGYGPICVQSSTRFRLADGAKTIQRKRKEIDGLPKPVGEVLGRRRPAPSEPPTLFAEEVVPTRVGVYRYDPIAVDAVSKQLGHSRRDVVLTHYLR